MSIISGLGYAVVGMLIWQLATFFAYELSGEDRVIGLSMGMGFAFVVVEGVRFVIRLITKKNKKAV